MNSSVPQKNNIGTKMRGLAILLVLFVLVLVPIFSSADSLPEKDDSSDYHGYLNITAPKNILLPFKSELITTEDIVKVAQPGAILTRPTANVADAVVLPVYLIEDKDLERVNAATNINQSVVITLYGQHEYYCVNCKSDKSIVGKTNIKINFTNPSYTVTFIGNGGKVDGAKKQVKTLVSENKNGMTAESIMPQKVTRDGYKFKGWSFSKEKNHAFTSETIVTDDITVYAMWKKDPVKPEKPEKPDKPDKPVKPFKKDLPVIADKHTPTETRLGIVLADIGIAAGSDNGNSQNENGSGNDNGNNAKVYTRAEFMSLAQEQDVPVATIGNGSVPLFAPEGAGGWAFVNLLLAAMGIVMALACLIISLKDGKELRSLWFILTAAAGVIGLVLFFLTENFKLNMVLTDQWTVANAILFIVTIVGMILFLRKKEEPEEFTYKY